MFGAFAASPKSVVKGYGAGLGNLTFGMLVFPRVWNWYMTGRERKRGFYTMWVSAKLILGTALTRKDTVWLRTSTHLAEHLRPSRDRVSIGNTNKAQTDKS